MGYGTVGGAPRPMEQDARLEETQGTRAKNGKKREENTSAKAADAGLLGLPYSDAACAATRDLRQQQWQRRMNNVDLPVVAKMSHSNGAKRSFDRIRNETAVPAGFPEDATATFMDTLRTNNHRVMAEQERLTQKMLALRMSQMHQELITMTAREAQHGGAMTTPPLPPQHPRFPASRRARQETGNVAFNAMLRSTEETKRAVVAAHKKTLTNGGDRNIGILPMKKRSYRPPAA